MPLSEKQHSILCYCEQFFLQYGRLPVAGDVVRVGHKKADFMECLPRPDFNLALELRGITPYTKLNSKGQVSEQLTPEQLQAANTMQDLRDTRSQAKKLKELKIDTLTWEAWLREPAFNRYLKARAENALNDNSHEAHNALINRVRSGDLGAIKYYNEITGRYQPAANGAVDVQGILFKVMEIIQLRVSDPDIQAAIATDLIKLAEPVVAKYDNVPLVAMPTHRTLELTPVGSRSFDSDTPSEGLNF